METNDPDLAPGASASLTTARVSQALEAALLTCGRPLTMDDLSDLFNGEVGLDTLRGCLDALAASWTGKGFQLHRIDAGWRVLAEPDVAEVLTKLTPERAPRYSKAVLETLAIIAYQQPVTRADIEEVRGVGVSTQVLKQLEDRGWIEVVGQRDAPGRPALWSTTPAFLAYMGASTLDSLYVADGDDASALVSQQFELGSVRDDSADLPQAGLPDFGSQPET